MGSNPCRRLSLLGFVHPIVGPPLSGTQEDDASSSREYEEDRVVALIHVLCIYIRMN